MDVLQWRLDLYSPHKELITLPAGAKIVPHEFVRKLLDDARLKAIRKEQHVDMGSEQCPASEKRQVEL